MSIHAVYRPLLRHFRAKRMRHFQSKFDLKLETQVLDVGGHPFNWGLLDQPPQLTFLNIHLVKAEAAHVVVADGCHQPFRDHQFDVVYSNSVIEHLSCWENQQAFARECRRIGRRYYVQTPNQNFFIEPHYLAPFIHWLPVSIQRRLARHATLWGWLTKPTLAQIDERIQELRLLNERELRQLFPDAEIWRERFLGITKSLMAAKVWGAPVADPQLANTTNRKKAGT
jgi:hypothetical protein